MINKPFNLGLILSFAVAAGLFLFSGTSSARVVKQVHPPAPRVLPRPPEQYQTVSFYKWASKDIIKIFKDNELEVVDLQDGLIIPPPGAKESTIFLIPSYGKDVGGTVAGYDSEKKLEDAITYFSMMNREARSFVWRIYRKDNILLLISGSVPEEKAREYEKVLNEMGKE